MGRVGSKAYTGSGRRARTIQCPRANVACKANTVSGGCVRVDVANEANVSRASTLRKGHDVHCIRAAYTVPVNTFAIK